MDQKTDSENQENRTLSRRTALGLIGAVATGSLLGTFPKSVLGIPPVKKNKIISPLPSCIVTPQQTEGPYFVDEKLNRADVRKDPADGSVKDGAELKLMFQVSQVKDGACVALPSALVDIWQCDALGVYSDVQDRSFDTRGKKFLRGQQMTDKNGKVEFTTIFPGWYPGRAVHIHFKVRSNSSSGNNYESTSQVYFDDLIIDKIHALAPYASKGQRTLRNDRDGIFRRSGQQLTVPIAKNEKGYAGSFDIGLQLS